MIKLMYDLISPYQYDNDLQELFVVGPSLQHLCSTSFPQVMITYFLYYICRHYRDHKTAMNGARMKL